ncbi:MAG: EboA domain-containing protein [Bacteroidota bacterium]
MPESHITTENSPLATKLILKILAESLDSETYAWISSKYESLTASWKASNFHMTFGMVGRKLPRSLAENPEQYQEEANEILAGWKPQLSSLECLARILLISAFQPSSEEEAQKFLWDVFDTADMWEQVAVFSSLPVLAYPQAYVKLAAEGLRTNMAPVFDAVALNNPYPAVYFSEDAWNQMYLKAAFVGRPISQIQSIPQRANEKLSRIILDYVDERWSAGREVSPEFWQASSQFVTPAHLLALKKLATHEKEVHRAVVDVIRENNPLPDLTDLDLNLSKKWSWEQLGETYNKELTT